MRGTPASREPRLSICFKVPESCCGDFLRCPQASTGGAGHGYAADGMDSNVLGSPQGIARNRTVSASTNGEWSDDEYRAQSGAVSRMTTIPERRPGGALQTAFSGREWAAHVIDNEVVKDADGGQHAVFLLQVNISLESYVVKRRFKRFHSLQREVRRWRHRGLALPRVPRLCRRRCFFFVHAAVVCRAWHRLSARTRGQDATLTRPDRPSCAHRHCRCCSRCHSPHPVVCAAAANVSAVGDPSAAAHWTKPELGQEVLGGTAAAAGSLSAAPHVLARGSSPLCPPHAAGALLPIVQIA
jgi:hypothetical protein